MLYFRFFAICIDPKCTILPYERQSLQNYSMTQFFHKISREIVDELSSGGTIENVCAWHSIDDTEDEIWVRVAMTCKEGILVKVEILQLPGVGHFRIEFLPNSVEHFTMHTSSQPYVLDTRLLPLRARRVSLFSNKLMGSPDLTSLPPKIVEFWASHNHFTGPVVLTQLPGTLQEIDLSCNQIAQKAVYYADLPLEIRKIDLGYNKVKEARPVRSVESVRNRRRKTKVFPMLREY